MVTVRGTGFVDSIEFSSVTTPSRISYPYILFIDNKGDRRKVSPPVTKIVTKKELKSVYYLWTGVRDIRKSGDSGDRRWQ